MAIYSDLFVRRFSWCISAWFFTDTLSCSDPQSLLLASEVAGHVVIHLLFHLTPVLLTTHSTLREGERDYTSHWLQYEPSYRSHYLSVSPICLSISIVYYLQPLSKAAEGCQILVYSREVVLPDVGDTPTADPTNQTQGSTVVQQGRGDCHHHGNGSAFRHLTKQTEKGRNICDKIIGQNSFTIQHGSPTALTPLMPQ